MKILLKHANVLTMENETILKNTDILVEDGKITKIGPSLADSAQTVVDLNGKYLMPGLFDMHVHFNDDTMLRMFLAFGVTSTRCMWGYPIVRRWERLSHLDEIVCPNIYSTSPLMDGVVYWYGSALVKSVEQAEEKVRRFFDEGYRLMKVYPSIPKDALLKIFEVSNELGARVVGHKSKFFSGKELADMGIYSIEHVGQLPDDLEEIEYMAKSGMWFCPTQTVEDTIRDYVYLDKRIEDIPYIDCLPPMLVEDWKKTTTWRKTNGRYDLTKPYDEELTYKKARTFMKHSRNILLGTDAANPGVLAGYSIHVELQNMVSLYGMTPFEAIETGTTLGALHLGLENSKGKIKEGFDSDLLVLDENPLSDIRNTEKIYAVMKGKQFFDRARLDGMIKTARETTDKDVYDVFHLEGDKNR